MNATAYAWTYPERLEAAAMALCAKEVYLTLGHPGFAVEPTDNSLRMYDLRFGAPDIRLAVHAGVRGYLVFDAPRTPLARMLVDMGWTVAPGDTGQQTLQPPQSTCERCAHFLSCGLEGTLPDPL